MFDMRVGATVLLTYRRRSWPGTLAYGLDEHCEKHEPFSWCSLSGTHVGAAKLNSELCLHENQQ